MSITAINGRYQFRGKVREITEGPVVSEVDVENPAGLIATSAITTRSVKELGLAVGKDVVALVKATAVSSVTLGACKRRQRKPLHERPTRSTRAALPTHHVPAC